MNFTFPKFKIVSKAFRVPCDFKPEEKYCMKNVNHRIKCFSFSCLFWKTVGLETMKRTVTTITNYVGKLCIYSHVLKCSNSGDSEKATKYCEISTVDFSYVMPVKFTVVISQNFVAFSEYMK